MWLVILQKAWPLTFQEIIYPWAGWAYSSYTHSRQKLNRQNFKLKDAQDAFKLFLTKSHHGIFLPSIPPTFTLPGALGNDGQAPNQKAPASSQPFPLLTAGGGLECLW